MNRFIWIGSGMVVIALAVAGGVVWWMPAGEIIQAPLPVTAVAVDQPILYRPATVAITVLDEGTDRWFTKAELYLKIESSIEPGVAQLLPVNIGSFRGRREVVHETCFSHETGRRETLVLEWLDDQTLSGSERAAIVGLINEGGTILADSAQLWLLRRGVYNRLSGLRAAAREFGTAVAGADARQFKSFGRAVFNVPDVPPTSFQESNVITVQHQQTQAKAELRFYYTPR